jgi:cyclopropane-fatty-acyl-phospholipid synthase
MSNNRQSTQIQSRESNFLRHLAGKTLSRLSNRLPELSFAVTFWDGSTEKYGAEEPTFQIHIKTLDAAQRIVRDGGMGFGEAHMDSLIDISGSLKDLLKLQYTPIFNARTLSVSEKVKAAWLWFKQRNTLERVRKNVSHHYDLKGDFYKLWLDESMTYTCGYFRTPYDTLEQAQNNKHEHLCRKLQLEPGMTLIDIGCGWGAMMFYAAEHYGAICTGYTISEEQYKWLNNKIKERGLEGRVTVKLQDYREAEGQFDRWVSIGMFEQVGSQFITPFMKTIAAALKPGGLGVLHTGGYRKKSFRAEWIERYIFPGGFLPSLAEMTEPMGELHLNVYDVEDLRLHYGETLEHWDKRFCENIDAVRAMYDERFVRMWRLYLNGAASAFRYGGVHIYQLAFYHGTNNSLYRTRANLYDGAIQPERFEVEDISHFVTARRGEKE